MSIGACKLHLLKFVLRLMTLQTKESPTIHHLRLLLLHSMGGRSKSRYSVCSHMWFICRADSPSTGCMTALRSPMISACNIIYCHVAIVAACHIVFGSRTCLTTWGQCVTVHQKRVEDKWNTFSPCTRRFGLAQPCQDWQSVVNMSMSNSQQVYELAMKAKHL